MKTDSKSKPLTLPSVWSTPIWKRVFGLQEIQHIFMRRLLHVSNEAVLQLCSWSEQIASFLMKAILIMHTSNLGKVLGPCTGGDGEGGLVEN